LRRPVFYAAVAALAGLGSAAELTNFARSDIAFLLHAAARLLDGAKLYVDLVEINPPLIIGINLLPVALGRIVGIPDVLAYRVLTIALLFGSLALSARVIVRTRLVQDDATRRRLLLLVAAVLFLMPGIDFGQREHLMLAFLLPYLFLAMARAAGGMLPPGTSFALGLLAGIGLALKPHFLLLWVALEIYLRLRSRNRSLRPWPESVGIAAFLILYGIGIALLTPEYFGLVASVGHAYAGYLHDPMLYVLVTAPATTVCFLAALAVAALAAKSRHRSIWIVLVIASVSGFVAAAAQQKGWAYHFYPSAALGVVLLGFVAMDVRRPLPRAAQRIYAAVTAGTVVAVIGWAGVLATTRSLGRDPVQEKERAQLLELEQAVRRHAPGGSLYVFSYTIGSSFPLVNYSGVRWASRFPHLWLIEAIYQDQLKGAAPLRYHTREEMEPTERYLNDAVYEDLARNRPELLMVLRHARDTQVNSLRRLDYVRYFAREPGIAQLLAGYRFVEDVGQYRFYARADLARGAGPAPRSDPGTADIIRYEVRGAGAVWEDRAFVFKALVFLLVTLFALRRESRAARLGAALPEPGSVPGGGRAGRGVLE
jgi:hypothetical protein